MALSPKQQNLIEELLRSKIVKKLKTYGRETTSMPFLDRLIQDGEKVAAYSFIHSIATSLGQSVFEEVSYIIAEPCADDVDTGYDIGGVISDAQKNCINNIVRRLRNGERNADIKTEMKEVLNSSSDGGKMQKEGQKVDFYMRKGDEEYFFELKTVKPNIDVFNKSKTKLLEWVARRGKPVNVYLVFPYNPYHPEPYERFTLTGMMDPPNDFLVGEEYWDFIGGEGTFSPLLAIFDKVGKEFKSDLDEKFKEIAAKRSDNL